MTQSNNQSLLGDIRVVELATMVFAPSACVVLADFGAEVIKVEAPGTGDLNRTYHQLPGMPVSDIAYTFEADNRNKKSIVLDLKKAAGRAALLKLLDTADIFVTNLRPAALARLRLDYDALKTLNSRLIYAHATAYGDHGADSDKPGYDTISYWSRSGIEGQVFPFEGWLSSFPFGAGDHPSGMTLFAGIMTALYRRQQTGEGCKVSSSLLANGTWANATMLQAQLSQARFQEKRPRSNAHNFAVLHYRSRDGRLLKLGMVNVDKDWRPFCQALARADLLEDARFHSHEARMQHMPALIAELTNTFATHDTAHWQKQLELHDIPHAALATYPEAAADPQKLVNDIIVPMQHPAHAQMKTVSSPFALSECAKADATAAPQLGQHTREVLLSLGYSETEITALVE